MNQRDMENWRPTCGTCEKPMFYYPAETRITIDFGGACEAFGAWKCDCGKRWSDLDITPADRIKQRTI